MYAIDYVALNLQLPLWVDSFNGLATKGQMLQAASKIVAENPKLTPDQAEKLKRCFEQRGRSETHANATVEGIDASRNTTKNIDTMTSATNTLIK